MTTVLVTFPPRVESPPSALTQFTELEKPLREVVVAHGTSVESLPAAILALRMKTSDMWKTLSQMDVFVRERFVIAVPRNGRPFVFDQT